MTKKQTRNKWVALIVEAVIGSIFGALLGLGLGFLMARVVPASGGGFQDLVAGILGLIAGASAGATLGVVLAGRYLMYQYGVWWIALIGGGVGVILAFALAPLLLTGLDNQFPLVVAISTGLFSAIAYGWSAR